MLNAAQIARACSCSLQRATNWHPALTDAMAVFAIDSPERIAAFLAQIAHESGRLAYVREIWGPTPAQLRYEGRRDLGNVQAGDGYRYRGRGLIQVTGRANYVGARDGLGAFMHSVPDFEAKPEALEIPRWAAMSAGHYWHSRRLNALADAGDFVALTRRINGGTNGMDDRSTLWAGARAAVGLA